MGGFVQKVEDSSAEIGLHEDEVLHNELNSELGCDEETADKTAILGYVHHEYWGEEEEELSVGEVVDGLKDESCDSESDKEKTNLWMEYADTMLKMVRTMGQCLGQSGITMIFNKWQNLIYLYLTFDGSVKMNHWISIGCPFLCLRMASLICRSSSSMVSMLRLYILPLVLNLSHLKCRYEAASAIRESSTFSSK